MTTETMTLRQALAEKKLLDNKIKKLSETLIPVEVYYTSEPYIKGLTPEQTEENIVASFQSLNDMIRRREAINLAILNQNATAVIEVPKFVTFEKVADKEAETEFISLAAAINRKNYYKTLLDICKKIQKTASVRFSDFDAAYKKAKAFSQQVIDDRYKDKANAPKDINALIDVEFERNKPVMINPLDAANSSVKWIDAIETYLSNIDTKLSSATEVYSITINY